MKILYTSDLHGHTGFYREIITRSKNERIDAVILGGDLLPRRGHLIDSLEIQKDFVKNEIRRVLIRLKEETHAPVYLILGNDDWAATLPLLRELEEENLLHLLHDKTHELTEDFIIIGYPYVPPTPFSFKDFEKWDTREDPPPPNAHSPAVSTRGQIQRVDEENLFAQRTSIQEDMKILTKPKTNQRAIYVFHSPPHDTFLDRLSNGKPAGSRAIRDFIEKEQPYMTLHGHIHESPVVSGHYCQKIGKTLSINPGQNREAFSAVIFDPHHPEETLTHTRYGKPNEPHPVERIKSS